jgi:hypothetical protein
LLTGSGQSKDCTWTKAGNVDVEVSGEMGFKDDFTPELHITLAEKWIYTQTTICDDQTWSQDIELTPEPVTYKIPPEDGFVLDRTITNQNVVSHIRLVLHMPEKN